MFLYRDQNLRLEIFIRAFQWFQDNERQGLICLLTKNNTLPNNLEKKEIDWIILTLKHWYDQTFLNLT